MTTPATVEPLEPRVLLDAAPAGHALELYAASPALFVANQGQWPDESVHYALSGKAASVLFTDTGPMFELYQDAPAGETAGDCLEVSVGFDGAARVTPTGLDPADATFNYFLGEQSAWRTSVPAFQTVAYLGLYEGVDLYTWGRRSSLKYEFHVAPEADWSQIRVQYEGIDGLWIDASGALHVQTAGGELVDEAPYIYQDIDGRRVEVPGAVELLDARTYTFRLDGGYDPAHELIIDPDLVWSTFLGGGFDDLATGVAFDAIGNAVLSGSTSSPFFDGARGVYKSGSHDAFAAKVRPDGSLQWASYFGDFGDDLGEGVAVDFSQVDPDQPAQYPGDVLIVGSTSSTYLTGAVNQYRGGPFDAFVARLDPAGRLLRATFLGGSGSDFGAGIAVDPAGNALVTGQTNSSRLALQNNELHGLTDAFVSKVGPDGLVMWSTFLGGEGFDAGAGIAVDPLDIGPDGSAGALVTGFTDSGAFVGQNNAPFGEGDAFVARVARDGVQAWATHVGGSELDTGSGIAASPWGSALLTGATDSGDFIGAVNAIHGGRDAFVAEVSHGGLALGSTYLGGSGDDAGNAIAADPFGGAVVAGVTDSTNFAGAVNKPGGGLDAFLAAVDLNGTQAFAAYLGGSGDDAGFGVALRSDLDALVAGATSSPSFPLATNPYHGGPHDAFVARIADVVTPPLEPEVTVLLDDAEIADDSDVPIDFGAVPLDSAKPVRTFTVVNDGDLPLLLGPVAVPDGFALVEPLAAVLFAGEQDTFTIELGTDRVGVFEGDVVFATNDADEDPFNFAIRGEVLDGYVTVVSLAAPDPPAAPEPGRAEVLSGTSSTRFQDADGQWVTVLLRGRAEATLYFDADGWCDLARVVIEGAKGASLTIRTAGRGSRTTVGDIVVHGSMRTLWAPTTDLMGDLSAEGLLRRIVLGDVDASHTIELNTAGLATGRRTVRMTFGRVRDTSIDTNGLAISWLTATEWIDSDVAVEPDVIEAPSIGFLNIRGRRGSSDGDFQANLVLDGSDGRRRTLGGAWVAGSLLDSVWQIAGNVGWVRVRGTVQDSVIRSAGSIAGLRLGATAGSDFLAGVDVLTPDRFADAAADFLDDGARIGWIVIRGLPGRRTDRCVIDSHFSAPVFGTVRLRNPAEENAYGLHVLGEESNIGRVSCYDALTAKGWTWRPGEEFPTAMAPPVVVV